MSVSVRVFASIGIVLSVIIIWAAVAVLDYVSIRSWQETQWGQSGYGFFWLCGTPCLLAALITLGVNFVWDASELTVGDSQADAPAETELREERE